MTLSTLLSDRAKSVPSKVCIKFQKNKFTYSEVDRHVNRTAGGLQKVGLHEKDRAAIIMKNCPEYIISYFAILRAGGIAVPINTFLIAEEVAYILRDSGCKILIYEKSFEPIAGEIRNLTPEVKTIQFSDIPQQTAEPARCDDNNVALLLYTSGTTGFPKGAILTHRNLISNVKACTEVMKFTHKDRVLLFLPLFHSFSFNVCVLVPIYSGACIVLLESVKPFSRVLNSIFRDRITLFVAVPTVYNILSHKKMPFVVRYIVKYLLSIRACVSGASALPEKTLNAFEKRFKIPLLEGYGLTEASPVVSVNPLKGIRKSGSVGPPLPGIEAAVIGEDGKKVASGEIGELIVKGPNVMKGYYNKKEETESALKGGWLYTGDMAKIDNDGYIFIVDRKKDLIIVDGMNIYPREIEDAVLKNPLVEECAMVGIPDERGSEITVLYIKKKENTTIDEQQIRGYLKEHFAQFKLPKRIVFIDTFPKTATGKIKKSVLREQGYHKIKLS
jgi:long-chain acyl-CoA synthetase